MKNLDIDLSNLLIHGNRIDINLSTPYKNIIIIDKIDYIPYYLNNLKPGNRGANSYVLKLIEAQNSSKSNLYPDTPDLVIKICKFYKAKFGEHPRSERFKMETDALIDCNGKNLPNLMDIHHYGISKLNFNNKFKGDFRYFTMNFAEKDLKTYLIESKLDLIDRLQLGIDICSSLSQLWSKGYYHRDIKPDNILFIDDTWMISDLGIVEHRDSNSSDDIGEWIGPRGWMSPESMNKFLSESTPWYKLHDCKINHQSDIYQIGKILWFILQGNSPEGGIKRNDFLWKNETIYQIIRTMLNNSKNRRSDSINNIITQLEREKNKIIKSGKVPILNNN